MPLKELLGEKRSFDAKDASILLRAYDGAVAELGLRTVAEKEAAAKIILRLALGQPDLDAAKLRAGVAALMIRKGKAPEFTYRQGRPPDDRRVIGTLRRGAK